MKLLRMLVLATAGPLMLLAQETRGVIFGLVTDPSSAALASATVTVKNVDTGVVSELKTNDSGHYEAPLRDGRRATLTLDPDLQKLAEKLLNAPWNTAGFNLISR